MAPPRRSPTGSSPRPPRRTGGSAPDPGNADAATVAWLLEPSQPAVRSRVLTGLLHLPPDDPQVRAARAEIPSVGWAADLLAGQLASGAWSPPENFYHPKYQSTNWKLLVLADLGMTRADPRIERACDLWLEKFVRPDGGFMSGSAKTGHLCATGNTVRALLQFGYEDDPRVQGGLDWLVRNQAKLGGWSCFGSGRNLDSWEPLSAFAVVPRAHWTPEIREAVEKGAEFFLQRELHLQGEEYAPWDRFHYPIHYYYDLLVGLDLLTTLGFGGDPRLSYALGRLRDKRRPDGRWNLDAVHPDVEGGTLEWYAKHPRDRPTPLAFETVGAPSKMITLTALRVLDAVQSSAPRPRGGAGPG